MKAEIVFNKAAVKVGMEYLGKARDGQYIFGYFKNKKGEVLRSFYFPTIKEVVESLSCKALVNAANMPSKFIKD